MEGLKLRAFIIAGVFLAFGAYVIAVPRVTRHEGRTEEWMEKKAPSTVGEYRMLSGTGDPAVTYTMDESTYKELKPYGIVARVFEHGEERYDVVLIASNRKSSFHDPRVCFRAQGWIFKSEEQQTLQTSRGAIPFTMVTMKSDDDRDHHAAFFYRKDSTFYSTPDQLTWAMLMDQFKADTDIEGVFYRFIAMHPDATEEQLKNFIRLYMDEAPQTSGGFF